MVVLQFRLRGMKSNKNEISGGEGMGGGGWRAYPYALKRWR